MQTIIYEAELELKPEWSSLLARPEFRDQVRHPCHACLHVGSQKTLPNLLGSMIIKIWSVNNPDKRSEHY